MKKHPSVIKLCRVCKRAFSSYPSQKRITCGRKCRDRYTARPKRFDSWRDKKALLTVKGRMMITWRNNGITYKKYEHVAVAEAALGRTLPPGAEVHHVDGDPTNNAPSNLVICQDHKYHSLLHARANQVSRGAVIGETKYCSYCRTVKPRVQFYPDPRMWDGLRGHCSGCVKSQNNASYSRRNG